MGVFSKIFGTAKAVDDITDKDSGLLVRMGGWVNELHMSEEEKSKASQAVREWGLQQLDALAPFKVVQRILAFAATFLWLVVGLSILVALWIGGDTAAPFIEFGNSEYVFWPVITVYALYFSGGVIDSWRRKVGGASNEAKK